MSRPVMRHLSRRWQHLQCVQRVGIRQSSRYSQPGNRHLEGISISSTTASSGPEPSIDANPYLINEQVKSEKERSTAMKRIRWATTGLFFSVLGLGIVSYHLLDALQQEQGQQSRDQRKHRLQLDAPDESNAKFQGREVHVIGAGEDKRIVVDGQALDLVETGTSSVPYFPKTTYLPQASSGSSAVTSFPPESTLNPGNVRNDEEYALVGLGIRTVSIFGIQVYVLGLYVRTADLSTLQSKLIRYVNENASTLVPSEKDELRSALLDPVRSVEIWEHLLKDTNVKSAWRISPTRNTDFSHLRDGWITGIKKGTQAATAAAKQNGPGTFETEYDSEEFGNSIKVFKDLFGGGGRAPKGSVMTLVMDHTGGLDVLFEDPAKKPGLEKLGHIGDARIGRLIWMGYLAGKNVSSEAARKGVADGCLTLASRPVGSAETMVT